ncbi:zinc finger, AN1-type domain [Coemansia sp. RSA 2049]|nr:zinc finger, AN1-type domain [Coemansia sp. RSA 2049]
MEWSDNGHDRIVPACPICGDVIATNPDEEPDIVINRHIESGMCSPKAKHNNGNGSSNRKGPASGPKGGGGGGGCAAKGCTTKTHAWTICSSCKKRYCLKHRFPDVHDCQTMRASSLPTFSSRIDALIGKNSSNSNSNNSSPAPNGRPASTSPASRAGAGRGKRSGQTKFKDSGCVIA